MTAVTEPTITPRTESGRVWLLTAPIWLLTAGAFAVTILLHGVGPADHMFLEVDIARDPFSGVMSLPNQGWLFLSPLLPLIGAAVGATTSTSLAWLHFVLAFVIVAGCGYLVARWIGATAGRLFVLAWFLSPESSQTVTQLGQFDIATIGAATFIAAGPAWACGAGGLVLGFNHFEQGIFAVLACVVLRVVIGGRSIRPLIVAGVGLAAGKLLLTGYLAAAGVTDATSARADFVSSVGLEGFWQVWRGHLPVLVFSVYGLLWLPMIAWWRTVDRRSLGWLIGVQVAFTLPVLLSYDGTRVYATMTWPLVIGCVAWAATLDRATLRPWVNWLTVAGALIPRVMISYVGVNMSLWDRFWV
jgi:hypothetical protein